MFPPAAGTHNLRSRETTRVTQFANLHIGSFANYSLFTIHYSLGLSVDPMSGKYPSLSPYTYCADNPVKLVDPNGEEITNADDPPRQSHLSINGSTAVFIAPDGTSAQFNLQIEKEYNSLVNNVKNALSNGSTVVGTAAVAGENSRATFRMTNSKGELDFKFYANGWKGNRYVAPMMLSKVAKGIKVGGDLLGATSAAISFVQATQAANKSERNWLVADGCAGVVALTGPYGMAASLYYMVVIKNADKIFKALKQDALDRADMMRNGYPAFRIGMR